MTRRPPTCRSSSTTGRPSSSSSNWRTSGWSRWRNWKSPPKSSPPKVGLNLEVVVVFVSRRDASRERKLLSLLVCCPPETDESGTHGGGQRSPCPWCWSHFPDPQEGSSGRSGETLGAQTCRGSGPVCLPWVFLQVWS